MSDGLIMRVHSHVLLSSVIVGLGGLLLAVPNMQLAGFLLLSGFSFSVLLHLFLLQLSILPHPSPATHPFAPWGWVGFGGLILGNLFAAASYLASIPSLALLGSYLVVVGVLVAGLNLPRLVWREFRESEVVA